MQLYPVQEGEEVLWGGAPLRPRKWFPEYTQMIMLVALIVFFVVISAHIAALFPAIGLLVGISAFFHQRLLDRRARDRALSYLVTSRRIIFVANWPSGTEFRWVWVRYLHLSPQVKVDETGVGTITFGSRWSRSRISENELRGAWAPPVPELRAIPDARRVADLIEQARNQATGTYTQSP
ncbi:hypothetical protein ACFWIW_06780 [Amycolatopsis sp. NPDC058340]|uniref:hypothetical protein n=1 Tax=Amycolatopsis sp. NPDC058340 TaxID=3346453 RepID=UPI003664A633